MLGSLRGCKKERICITRQLPADMLHKEVSTGKIMTVTILLDSCLWSQLRRPGDEIFLSIWQIKKSVTIEHENPCTECHGWVNPEWHLNYMTKWDHSGRRPRQPWRAQELEDKQRRIQQLGTSGKQPSEGWPSGGRNSGKCGGFQKLH